jgi:hypothetical protein
LDGVYRKIFQRLVPFLMLLWVLAWIDRVNIGFIKLTMLDDLKWSEAVYGFGAGVMTVARALLPLALFSPREFGLQSARLSLPQNLANAIAPVIFTAILDRAGTGPALFACAVLAALSLGFVLMLMALVRGAHASQPSPVAP